MSAEEKDTWVFNAQATSTLLIAAWYVFGVFIALGILGSYAKAFSSWGAQWVIPLLLSVFYFGAGYLFQRHECIDSFSTWRAFMKRKTITLLTPFFAFAILTLLTASMVSLEPELIEHGIVNAVTPFSGEAFVHAVLIEPVGPVGYFIVLWGFFIITRTPRTKGGMGVLIALALALKGCTIVLADTGITNTLPYYLLHMMNNWIWFIAGMALSFSKKERTLATKRNALCLVVCFCAFGALLFGTNTTEAASLALLGALGLASFYSISGAFFLEGAQVRFYGFVTRYTMAIWLMHQIIAKLCFCALFALGISWSGALANSGVAIYAIVCLVACYVLPILVMKGLSRVGKLGFIVYPSRYLPEKL
jgi:hypothetical protein